MFKNIGNGYKEFVKKPVAYIFVVLLSVILNLITLGAVVGAFLIIYYLISLFGLGGEPIIVGVIAAVLFVIYLVLMNGLKGSLIKSLGNLTKNKKPSVRYFFGYAVHRGEVFFVITLLKYIVGAIFVVPVYLLYSYVLLPMAIPYIEILTGIVIAGIMGIIEFPFMYSYIACANQELSVIGALKSAFRVIKRKPVGSFVIYIIYAIIWLTMFIPFVDIVTAPVLFPMMYTSAILFYEKYR